MKRAWRRDGLADLERRLRDERPRPSEELVRRVAGESPARASLPRMRLGLAGALSGVALAVVIALGGLGSPIDTAARIGQFDNAGGKSDGHGHHHHGKPAHHQYDEKVTICHRPPGHSSNGQTLTLPRQAAEEHLRNHRSDSRGPCPPPPPPPPHHDDPHHNPPHHDDPHHNPPHHDDPHHNPPHNNGPHNNGRH